MTGLRAQKKRRTKQDLATAAVDLLLSEGRDGATVASIAARAGVSTRTFHNYFAAREDAFLHFVEEIVAEWIREVESAPADETPFETLHRTIRDLCNRPGGDSTAAANLMTITEHALAGMGMEGRARVVGMFAGVVDIIVARSDGELSRFRAATLVHVALTLAGHVLDVAAQPGLAEGRDVNSLLDDAFDYVGKGLA